MVPTPAAPTAAVATPTPRPAPVASSSAPEVHCVGILVGCGYMLQGNESISYIGKRKIISKSAGWLGHM